MDGSGIDTREKFEALIIIRIDRNFKSNTFSVKRSIALS